MSEPTPQQLAATKIPPSERREVRFTFEVDVPASAEPTQLWVPRPISDEWQQERAALFPDLPSVDGVDSDSGTRTRRFTVPPSAVATRVEVSFDIERKIRRRARPADEYYRSPPANDASLARYLEANLNVPLDGVISYQANTLGVPGDAPIALARRAFDYLLETLTYDWAGCTPERMDQIGDLHAACDLRTGTCTEFHGLLVGYMRVLGVPARFNFGFNLPRGVQQGRIAGYHCWSSVALPDASWFVIDVTEAWKRRDQADFYFGSLDADRVAFTCDRDVNLSPRQEAGPIDKFIFPYCETGGRPITPGLGFRFLEL